MALTLTGLHLLTMFLAAALFVAAAIHDARSYRIPNYLSGLLVLLFPIFAFSSAHAFVWQPHAVVFVMVAVAGFAAWLLKLMGAGDVKLIAASSLWAGPDLIAVFLTVMAFAGGVESLVLAFGTRRAAGVASNEWKKTQIPYGVAIAAGGLVMLGLRAKSLLLPAG